MGRFALSGRTALIFYLHYLEQVAAIDQLKSVNPSGHFWIKLDGTDVKAGIMESQKKVWNGDVDYDDGKLKELRDEYVDMNAKMDLLKSPIVPLPKVKEILEKTISDFKVETEFLLNGFKTAKKSFEEKAKQPNCPEATLKERNWEVVEYQTLLQQSQKLALDFQNVASSMPATAITKLTRSSLETLASYRTQYISNLYKKRHTSATHVVVTMLSDEKRTTKPYALPVRFIPCITLKDDDVRVFNQTLKKEMKKRDMHLAGMIFSNFVLAYDNLSMCTNKTSKRL